VHSLQAEHCTRQRALLTNRIRMLCFVCSPMHIISNTMRSGASLPRARILPSAPPPPPLQCESMLAFAQIDVLCVGVVDFVHAVVVVYPSLQSVFCASSCSTSTLTSHLKCS
jgi:hypothetical protein